MFYLTGFVGLSLLTPVFAAIGPNTNVYLGNKIIAPDGFNRSTVLAGSNETDISFPGPLITASKGETFHLNVIDDLKDTTMLIGTSIHWHGFFQKTTSWADGPAGVTQCPIASGHSFEYVFSTADQAGTYWYHSHFSTQYCDGLRGPMVVYDPNDPHKSEYDFDDESTVITLADWYHDPAPKAAAEAPAHVPTPNATLINGKGRFTGGAAVPLTVIRVLQNKRYRFRLVSISCDPNYLFSIDGHNMTIIEVDGQNVEKYTVDQIQIFAGQRYSFILTTDKDVSNYWIRAQPSAGDISFDGGLNSAILRYWEAPIADPNTTSSVKNPMLEPNLHPLTNPAAPGVHQRDAADVNINLQIGFNFAPITNFTVGATEVVPPSPPTSLLGSSFVPPTLPVLLQIISGKKLAQELLPSGSLFFLPPNKVIEISIPGGSAGSPHPIHLHGHAFSVIRSAGSLVDNYDNPVVRDVVSIGGAQDNVTIRFTTDNPGPWIMHCHIDWHLELGLAVVFAEDIDTVATENPPDSWDQLCPTFNALPPQTFPPN